MEEEEDFYCGILLETSLSILETIQEHQTIMSMTRVMVNDGTMFTFHRVLPNGVSIFAEVKLQRQPYLAVDLQNLFTTFYQILLCTDS